MFQPDYNHQQNQQVYTTQSQQQMYVQNTRNQQTHVQNTQQQTYAQNTRGQQQMYVQNTQNTRVQQQMYPQITQGQQNTATCTQNTRGSHPQTGLPHY
jgi:hypothetical protein